MSTCYLDNYYAGLGRAKLARMGEIQAGRSLGGKSGMQIKYGPRALINGKRLEAHKSDVLADKDNVRLGRLETQVLIKEQSNGD